MMQSWVYLKKRKCEHKSVLFHSSLGVFALLYSLQGDAELAAMESTGEAREIDHVMSCKHRLL